MENILKKGTGPGIRSPEFQSWFYHILDVWPWTNHLKLEFPFPCLQKGKQKGMITTLPASLSFCDSPIKQR